MTTQGGDPRRRNAAQSRELLLAAAGELFAENGYEKTTLREIGVRAGVDAALVARYFGSKAKLYLATLKLEGSNGGLDPIDVRDPARLHRLLERVRELGSGPSLWAAVRPHQDPELQASAVEMLEQRFLAPGRGTAEQAGLDQAGLRAEIVTAALAGIVMSRTAGTFPALTQADPDDLAPLIARMLTGLLEEEPPARS
ncbi:TetR family transcriptional regulator [Kineosporia sp. J2-2]|uniref:TetR family transcriptional regulator n=1 Tax=Kineosporia corallincola TaxID=2835133 RepID=A0ABS5TSC3_9ACTN|nr:TetR/AcrR family transcriptional regulator [Kineosporia corallincola]MBT0773687.1 TetR family transcriptional regulator [Kineosporia corallincola]